MRYRLNVNTVQREEELKHWYQAWLEAPHALYTGESRYGSYELHARQRNGMLVIVMLVKDLQLVILCFAVLILSMESTLC
ncbi:MAG: hypothetical protein ACLRS2_19710 [[Clostridium] innocuum]